MWDLIQHFQIANANKEASDNASKLRSQASTLETQRTRVGSVEDQVERLTLACQAMWELLRDHVGLTEEQLHEKILRVDARDGRIDGKINNEVISCPHCGQKTNTNKLRCTYCGKGVKATHTFKS